jgi:hypothetical protein
VGGRIPVTALRVMPQRRPGQRPTTLVARRPQRVAAVVAGSDVMELMRPTTRKLHQTRMAVLNQLSQQRTMVRSSLSMQGQQTRARAPRAL